LNNPNIPNKGKFIGEKLSESSPPSPRGKRFGGLLMNRMRKFVPPVVIELLLRLGAGGNRFKYGEKSFEEALAKSTGYNSKLIEAAFVKSSAQVRDGEAAYERDGVVFDSIQYSWPLLASIVGAPMRDATLRVLDWGGALGSTYRQNISLLRASGLEVEWTVLEQAHLAHVGKNDFTNNELSFVSDFYELSGRGFDLVLFASSICYLRDPQAAISLATSLSPSRIIFDRTPETRTGTSVIGIQYVGKGIYSASFPIHAFEPGALDAMIGSKYSRICDWESDLQPDPKTVSKGYVFQLNVLPR
jgi:putative methyltransferase (TIGR04325 family)